MWTGESHFSIAFIISAIILCIILFVCVAAIGLGLHGRNHPNYDRESSRWFIWCGFGVAMVTLIIYAFAWFPYKSEYHQYQKIMGTVESVNKRLVSSGSGDSATMEEKLVVTYDTGIQVGCLDTRCASLKTGDTLTMNCIRRYEWFSTSGYDCRFVEIR